MNSLILRTAVRAFLPVLLVYSFFLLVTGHNQPGGGFVGGLVAAAALALYAIAYDAVSARTLAIVNPRTLIGVGLGLALASGLLPVLGGLPLMTGLWAEIPPFGALGSPFLFDIGVYLVVIGVTLLMVLTLVED